MTEHLPTGGALRYMTAVREKLDQIVQTQLDAVLRAGDIVAQALSHGGMVYIFGTGHSHLMAEEGHYRAGGLAAVCPVLTGAIMLHEGAVLSTLLERTSGLAEPLLDQYQPASGDVLFIFSNSGVNALPVEMAQAAKQRGLTVIAVIALEYAAATPAGPAGVKLADLADLVLDNQGVPGDALVPVGASGLNTGPLSTIAGAFLLNAILTEATCQLEASGAPLPVYISANLPGASAHNNQLIARYRARNPHL